MTECMQTLPQTRIEPEPTEEVILDLNELADSGQENQTRATRRVRVNAPYPQLIVRCSLAALGILYYATHQHPPLLISLSSIIALIFAFLACHLYLYQQTLVHGFKPRYIVPANLLDILMANCAWLLDPSEPAPLVLFILIAAIGNGIQHGFGIYRSLLVMTAVISPVVFTARTMLIGFHASSLFFLLLSAFLLIYIYFLINRIDRLQSQAERRATDLEMSNHRLQNMGVALQMSEQRYRSIFEHSSAAMVLIEENMRISLTNSKFEQLTKYTKAELYNKKRLTDFIYEKDLERIKWFHARRKKTGTASPAEYECQLVDKYNNIRHVIIRFNFAQWHERIIATIVDITSRMQARAALQKSYRSLRHAAQMLRDSEKRYRSLFENTGTATIVVGKNMRITMINSKFAELTGFGREEIVGKRRLSEFIERKNLFRIKRFQARLKQKGLEPPTEYECLIMDKSKNLKHVVMKTYTPPGQEGSIVSFFDITQRKEAEAALQLAHERLQLVAEMDELTQVANRRRFDDRLNREWNRLRREGLPLSLIMCDVDCFKLYNDNYGHQNGDQCLRSIAGAIKRTVKRSIDLAARYGGEEFAIIMPNTNAEGALHVAEAIRLEVEQLKINNKASTVSPFITLSLGVACMIPGPSQSPDALIRHADNALYEAKRIGRNRTVLGKPDEKQKTAAGAQPIRFEKKINS